MTTNMVNGLEATETLLRNCVQTLGEVASFRLPGALDRRLLWLSENKETITAGEREELLALIAFAEERTVEKLKARALLKQIGEHLPHLLTGQT